MALDKQSLTRIHATPRAAGASKSLFHYVTDDTVANILASGYFNGATKELEKGDIIIASCVNGGTNTCTTCVVTSATGAATVTTAAATFT